MTVEDGLAVGWWLVANLLMLALGFAWSRQLSPTNTPAELVVDTLVSYLASITLVAVIAGIIGQVHAAGLAVSVFAVILMAAIGLRWMPSPHGDVAAPFRSLLAALSDNPCYALVWLIATALCLGQVVLYGVLRLPEDFDALAYHIPLIDHWIQSHSLCTPQSAAWFVGGNWEVVGLWFAAPFSGDFLVGLANVPFVLLWVVGVFRFAEAMGLARPWNHIAAMGSTLTLPLWYQTAEAANDLAVVAYFVASANYCVRYLSRHRLVDLVFFGVSVGLLAGVKHFAVGYAIVSLAIFILFSLSSGRSRAVKELALCVGLSVLCGGYWYLRNWWHTGLPLFPLQATPDGESLGYPSLWQSTLLGNGDPKVPRLALAAVWKMSGVWQVLAVVVTPGLLLYFLGKGIAVSLRRKDPPSDITVCSATAWCFSLFLAGTFAIWIVTPYAVEDQPGTLNHLGFAYTPVRYGLCFLTMASIGLAFLGQSFERRFAASRPARSFVIGGAVLLLIGQFFQLLLLLRYQFAILDTFLIGMLAVLCLGIGGALFAWSSRLGRIVLSVLVLLFAAAGVATLSARWHQRFPEHFARKLPERYFELTSSQPQRILVLEDCPYPFFGSRREHWVSNPRSVRSCAEILEIVRQDRITLIVTRLANGREMDRYRDVVEMLSEEDGKLQIVLSDERFRLYRPVLGPSEE